MKEFKRLIKKMNSTSGESIAETLVALLIASLALVILASMIQSTSNSIIKSKNKMNAYYTASANLENPDQTGLKVTIKETDTSKKYGEIEIDNVKYQENTTFSNKPVLAYSPA